MANGDNNGDGAGDNGDGGGGGWQMATIVSMVMVTLMAVVDDVWQRQW